MAKEQKETKTERKARYQKTIDETNNSSVKKTYQLLLDRENGIKIKKNK